VVVNGGLGNADDGSVSLAMELVDLWEDLEDFVEFEESENRSDFAEMSFSAAATWFLSLGWTGLFVTA
jgi:hypothetical protein